MDAIETQLIIQAIQEAGYTWVIKSSADVFDKIEIKNGSIFGYLKPMGPRQWRLTLADWPIPLMPRDERILRVNLADPSSLSAITALCKRQIALHAKNVGVPT